MNKLKKTRYREIKDRLQDTFAKDRVKTSMYLSAKLMKDFKEACGDASSSRVLEELMADFIKHTP